MFLEMCKKVGVVIIQDILNGLFKFIIFQF